MAIVGLRSASKAEAVQVAEHPDVLRVRGGMACSCWRRGLAVGARRAGWLESGLHTETGRNGIANSLGSIPSDDAGRPERWRRVNGLSLTLQLMFTPQTQDPTAKFICL